MRTLLIASITLFTTAFPGGVLAATFDTWVTMGKAIIRSSNDGKSALIEIPCSNISTRTITAWSYSIHTRYPDGSTSSTEGNVDIVSALLPGNEKLAFRPGLTQELTATFGLDGRGALPVAAEATLRSLVFDDLSAVGETQDINQFAASRRSSGKMMGNLLDDVEKARQRLDPKRELDALIAKHKSEGMVWLQLGPVFDRGPEAFEAILSMYRATRDLWIRQQELKPQDTASGK